MRKRDNIILSICIPTCNRVEILEKTVDSILDAIERNKYTNIEICISDNSKTDETKELVSKKYKDNDYVLYSQNSCEGFMNSIEALKLGKGKLLKLHNDYTRLNDQGLAVMRSDAMNNNDDSVIFYTLRSQKYHSETFDTFDHFLYNISYLSTWSTSFAIWKSDFERLMLENIQPNFMYPHTTLLFALTDKDKYIVNDFAIGENLQPKKKGGYNLLDNFMNIYLAMINDLVEEKRISTKTVSKIKLGILDFCARFEGLTKQHKDIYTFTFDNRNEIIKKNYPTAYVGVYEILYLTYSVLYATKKQINKIANK